MSTAPRDDRRPASSAQYRGDIDGLRAISIAVVVVFHGGVDRFAGGYIGVDVFFVISGFLITGLLVREVDTTGSISMREFYARRIRRLLPLSFATIVATLVAGLWLLPPIARERLVDDARSASLYFANWRFAGQATTYSDTEVTDSLLVHYWSLAIEEQFYILWPLLIIGGVWIARRVGRAPGPILAVLLGTLGLASFVASVVITNREGFGAYYLTHTRLWEMAVGAGLAFAIPRLGNFKNHLPDLIGVLGLGLIAYAAITYDAATAFPGFAAVVPVLGCALVLISGSQRPGYVSRALAIAPMRLLGRLSYAWYLLHWPTIGVALLLRERYGWTSSVNAVTAAAIAVSLLLAWGAHHLIENPARHAHFLRNRTSRNFALGLALTIAPILIGGLLLANVDRGDRDVVLATGVTVQSPVTAANDEVTANPACHQEFSGTDTPDDCVFGDPDGLLTVLLLGDSHARQWVDAFDVLGRQQGWRVVSWTKSACSIVDAEIYLPSLERPYSECDTWRDNVVASAAAMERVDVVLLVRSAGYRRLVLDGERRVDEAEVEPFWAAAAERTAAAFAPIADRVVLSTDTPWPGFSAPECLSENGIDIAACNFDLETAVRDVALIEAESSVVPEFGIQMVDAVPLVCTTSPCTVVDPDGVILYRDSHHLTRTYTLTLLEELSTWVTG